MVVKKSVPILLLVWIGLCGILDGRMDDFKMLKARKQPVKQKDSNMGRFSNASTLINNLLSNYDTRLRPNFGGMFSMSFLFLRSKFIVAGFSFL